MATLLLFGGYGQINYYRILTNKINNVAYKNAVIINAFSGFSPEEINNIVNSASKLNNYKGVDYTYRVVSNKGIPEDFYANAIVSKDYLNNISPDISNRIDFSDDKNIKAISFGRPELLNKSFTWKIKEDLELNIEIVANFDSNTLIPQFNILQSNTGALNIFTEANKAILLVENDALRNNYDTLNKYFFKCTNIVVYFNGPTDEALKELKNSLSNVASVISIEDYIEGSKAELLENFAIKMTHPIMIFILCIFILISTCVLSSYKFSEDYKVLRLNGYSITDLLILICSQFLTVLFLPTIYMVVMLIKNNKLAAKNTTLNYLTTSPRVFIYYAIFVIISMVIIYAIIKKMIKINEEKGILNDRM